MLSWRLAIMALFVIRLPAVEAEPARSAEELVQRLQSAIARKHTADFHALVHLANVSEQTQAMIRSSTPSSFAYRQPLVTLLPVVADAQEVPGFVWNVEVKGRLQIRDAAGADPGFTMPYGERDGGWWIATRIATKPATRP